MLAFAAPFHAQSGFQVEFGGVVMSMYIPMSQGIA
jgi:hypothetical protein